MQDLDLTPLLRKNMRSYPRTRGRYNSSELYGIIKGYVTPESWLYPSGADVAGMLRMWNGTLVHDHIQRLLPSECNEIKKEYRYKLPDGSEIVLVAKVDHLPNHVNTIWEFKTSEELMAEAKASHEYQAKLYCTVFERPQTDIYQPVQSNRGLYLKHIGQSVRDDNWFMAQMALLAEFHQKIEPLWEQKITLENKINDIANPL